MLRRPPRPTRTDNPLSLHDALPIFHRGQRGDADLTLQILDRGGAGEAVRAVDVHRARSANALAARAAESERRILIGLDLDQRVEDHRPAIVEINLENVVAGRSAERRVGNGCVGTGRSRWSPYP